MRQDLLIKGRSLTGSSDLTLFATIKPGFVPSLDAITYKTRAKRLMQMLTGGRASLHEYALYRPLSDSVERVAVIHSFRVLVQEPEDKIMLAVTFDGTWESYIRILWQKVGTLLDIIFCNTEDYVNSQSAGFEAWANWVRRVQTETHFYFNTHGLTVPDAAYLRAQDAICRFADSPHSRDLLLAQNHVATAEVLAWDASHSIANGGVAETVRQGLQSLAVLFRLTDTYLPGTPDGDVLRRAARDLLVEFRDVLASLKIAQPKDVEAVERRFGRQLQWLAQADQASDPPHAMPVLPDVGPIDMFPNVQAGILRTLEGVTHGCLVMLAIDNSAAGASLLDYLIANMTTEATRPAAGGLITTFSVSYEGLRALGLTEEQLALFPQEFREGMEARASMLGDFRTNHPRRWRLPVNNWNPQPGTTPPPVQMSTVHIVVQMRIGSPSTQHDPAQPDHPLHESIKRLLKDPDGQDTRPGVRVLAVQHMRRHTTPDGTRAVEHFGFADGMSDPVFDKDKAGKVYPNQIAVGEVLWGRDSEADVAPVPQTQQDQDRMDWLHDGSFLVVRKLKQNVDVLHNLMQQANQRTGLNPELIAAKMMGRTRAGEPLANQATSNDFDYTHDQTGSLCPFHSHIRRANPRPATTPGAYPPEPTGGRHPRLMRRGMSYGPQYAPPSNPLQPAQPDGQERGLMFMAYVSSLCEQFEVVQRWLTGGNSSGGHSRQSDPFLGVPEVRGPDTPNERLNERRGYTFEHNGEAYRIALDEAPPPGREAQPIVRLEWGMYLFAPSLAAVQKLREAAGAGQRVAPVWTVKEGAQAIQCLFQVEKQAGREAAKLAWKAMLEDPEAQEKFHSASVWAAIRTCHGGVLRTPYGVIVADRGLIKEVLGDRNERFSVAGYKERMEKSIGSIYLGLDAGNEYDVQSGKANEAISAISELDAFNAAFRYTGVVLNAFMKFEKEFAAKNNLPRWELNLDAKEVSDKVLELMCRDWFGLPDGTEPDPYLKAGSWRWDWKDDEPPIYPAQFTAPSRCIFQPWPNDNVQDFSQRMGKALTRAMEEFVRRARASGGSPKGPGGQEAPIAKAILGAFPDDDELTARTLSGALMGFLPTVDGNFRLSLNEWLRDGTYWSLRAAWSSADKSRFSNELEKAHAILRPALVQSMQLRPAPELIWRRATKGGFNIGSERVRKDDVIVLSLVSGAHQCLEDGKDDLSLVFGGKRSSSPHPTHACPGYEAGMGVLLGLLAGLISTGECTRPSPAALSFTFEGPAKATP
ncbi:Dyp-type peroxidase [Variovorax sp. J22R133]|uniref:Dyp-type peroxidase n=1 Tax=Variovorax brevis TaxID=3053503 RepID=UPI002578BF61|nr:Dyp-type peroxidase [Variovorax sp. J22R133]MDM0110590.1 Dyp-type peroxidase [Variovorax sp. J22R133]